MVSIQELTDMSKSDLIDIIRALWTGEGMDSEHIPKAFSTESSYKDALYSGYIDTELEFMSVTPGLSNITHVDEVIYLNGDEVKIGEHYKTLKLTCKGFTINGIIKTEIVAYMVSKLQSIKVGEFGGWNKYFISYKGHTLVANIKDAMAGLKLLKYDYMAKKLYEKNYKKRPSFNWREMDEDEAIYGSKDISLPNSIDNMLEEVEEACGVLERAQKYAETKQLVRELGWEYV